MDHNFHVVDTPDGEWITRAEFAEQARVSLATAKRWARQGIGPTPVRHGPRLVRYVRAEVEAWLRSGGQDTQRTAIDARIDELLAQLPPLTDEQRREAVAIFAAARPRRPRAAEEKTDVA